MTMATRDELTTSEAAEILGVTEGHVRWMIAHGRIAAHKRGSGNWINYLWRADVERYRDEPANRQPGVKAHDRTPRRYGLRYAHLSPALPPPPPDPLRVDVRALLEAYARGERDVDATTTAIIARVKEA